MTTIKERVLYISDYQKEKKEEFFKKLGLSYANFKGIQKKSALSSDAIDKITTKYPEIDLNWLITGKGEMLKPEAQQERALINAPFEEKQYINYNRLPAVVTVESDEEENILAVPSKLAAGYVGGGYMNAEFIEELPTFRLPYLRNGTFRCFEVQGYSMEEGIKDGDYFVGKFVDNIRNFGEGKVHALIIPELDSLLLKRVFRHPKDPNVIILRSDNNDIRNTYPDIYLDIRYVSEIWSFAAIISFTQTSYDNNKFNEILDTNPDAVYYLEENK